MDTIKKSWKIISNKSRSRLKIYLVLVFFVSILEVIGISLILPIISAINNDLINYDIYILHPYHNECKFNINLKYCKNTLNLEKICLKRYSIKKVNNYWEDNNSDIKEKDEGEFLFGKNIKIKKDLKYYKLKNKLNLYKNEYPYMYENKEEKENIKYKLPNNIKIEIPKRMNIINKIKIKWKFKNEYTKNILELKINNTEIEEINNFKYLI